MTTSPRYRLLVVDDEPDLRTLYELTLVREGYDVDCAGSVAEGWEALQAHAYHALITDMRLPDGIGLELIQRLETASRPEKAIVITAYGSAENAVEALKAGAYDYLTKPVDLRQFRAVVASALGRVPPEPREAGREPPPRREKTPAARPRRTIDRLVGASAAMHQVRSMIEKVARSMAPVLVHGESGTGKELVARAIHESSPRAQMPFVAVNCGAIPEALIEAEFFGYRKGAFTGANEDREGFFQAARGGTLFLDEIGDLPLAMQSKLLRGIQERAVRPVGAVAEAPVDVRLVSATHKDLAAEVHGGRFRQDLFYRLNVIQIHVPPLRERMGDLGSICDALLARIAHDAGVEPPPTLAAESLQQLARYGFPGNVRELENLLHRAVAMADAEVIEPADLGFEQLFGETVQAELETVGAPALVPVEARSTVEPLPNDLVAYLDQVEKDVLERALDRHRYNRTAAGASLGLSLRQMRYRMARLRIGAADGDGP